MTNLMSPIIEAAVLRQSEDTVRELVQAFRNVGLKDAQIALMLRTIAEEVHPRTQDPDDPRVLN